MLIIKFLTLLITLVGAINWGLWGFAKYDLIADLLKNQSPAWLRIIYAIIGLCGVYSLRLLFITKNYVKKQADEEEEADYPAEDMEEDDQ